LSSVMRREAVKSVATGAGKPVSSACSVMMYCTSETHAQTHTHTRALVRITVAIGAAPGTHAAHHTSHTSVGPLS
jgi:hypothetical protein